MKNCFNKAQKQIFNFCFCAFIFSSCFLKKNQEKPFVLPYYNDQEFNDYTIFPENSYWIYIDSLSGEEDSVYLVKQDVSIYDGYYHNEHPYEKIDNYYTSSYYKESIYETSNILKYGSNPPFSILWQSRNIITTYLYFSQSNVNDVLIWNNNLKYSTYKDSMTLSNGNTYEKVKQFTTLKPDGGDVKERYYSKGIGMIRKELRNGQIWNLQRYYIHN